MNLSFKQYRAIDLTIMAIVIAIAEAVVTVAANKWFPNELFSVSITLAIVCIVMMRWDGYAVIHAAIGGCIFCLMLGGSPQQFAIYCVGNCGALAALLLFKLLGKEKIAEKLWLSMLFVFTAFLCMELGRWAMSLILGVTGSGGTFEYLIYFFLSDIITLLFAELAVFISRRMDGLFEDQRAYLLRVNEEQRKEREARDQENNWY